MGIVSDIVVMPDIYSTGIERGVILTDAIDICTRNGINITNNRLDMWQTFKTALLNEGLAEVTEDNVFVINNVNFTEATRLNMSAQKITEYKTYRFMNCKFDVGTSVSNATVIGVTLTTDPSETNKWHYMGEPFEFIHCEFSGLLTTYIITSTCPTIFDHCYAHDLGSDAFGTDNPKSKRIDCYANHCGTANTFNGNYDHNTHADFIQTSGSMDRYSEDYVGTSKSYIRRCRSDIIQYHDTNGMYYMANASSYNDCDYGNIEVDIDYMWASGGNYPYRFEISDKKYTITGQALHLVAGSYMFGNHHIADGCNVEVDVADADRLLVGSVWTEDDVVNISVTNYTLVERKFKIETNLGLSEEFAIGAAPDQKVLSGSANQQTWWGDPISWDDFPYDKLYTIPAKGVNWVRVYDVTDSANTLVRTQVINDEKTSMPEDSTTVFNEVKELFTQICDAIRTKDGTTELINHTDIPQRILNL